MALTRNPNAEISVDEVRKVMAQHAKQSQAEVESGGQVRKLDQVNSSLERVSEELDLLNAGVAELQEAVRQARDSHEMLTRSLRFYARTVTIGSVLLLITAGAVLWILGGEAGMLPNLPSFGASARVEEKPAITVERPWWEQVKPVVPSDARPLIEQGHAPVQPSTKAAAPIATMQIVPTPVVAPKPGATAEPAPANTAKPQPLKTTHGLLFDSVRRWQLASMNTPIGDVLRIAGASPAPIRSVAPQVSISAQALQKPAGLSSDDPAAWWDEFIRNHRGADWWTPLTPESEPVSPINLSKENLSNDHLSKGRRSALPARSR